MKLTNKILKPYVDSGLVEAKRHATLPLTIYNYSRECQFDQKWDEVTLQCRGLILDDAGVIVARGFNKFFNYEEVQGKGEIPIQGDYVYVQEKMDGSLGILFYYADEWHMATRGSFHSDQAVEGLKILKEKYNDLLAFERSVTYLCEIIYPENRIVVDYGSKPRIVFLSVIAAGEELHWTTACGFFKVSGIRKADIVKTEQHFKFSPELYESLKAQNIKNSEGFVLRFQPDSFRMKIKFEDYVRLHRLLTNFSNVDIWECLRNGTDMADYLADVPDEFDSWVRDWIRALKFAFVMKEIDAKKILAELLQVPNSSKREDAEWIKANCPTEYQGLVFAMLSGKDYSPAIWRMIKPSYQKPFWSKDTA
jgi:RNA ligase